MSSARTSSTARGGLSSEAAQPFGADELEEMPFGSTPIDRSWSLAQSGFSGDFAWHVPLTRIAVMRCRVGVSAGGAPSPTPVL